MRPRVRKELRGGHEAMTRFLDSFPVGFQLAKDPLGQLATRFKIVSMPTTLLLDGQGHSLAPKLAGRIAEEWFQFSARLV